MSEKLTILIVDDETGMRLAIQRALRDFTLTDKYTNQEVGFNIITAGSGEDALEQIREHKPELMLLDYKLPNMTGTDVLQEIKEWEEKPLTIMITAFASLDTAVTAIKLGGFDFLAKPFTPAELKATSKKAVHHLLAVRNANRLAAEKRQVRFQMMSVLAHELKAPLAAIENFINLLNMPEMIKDEKDRKHLLDRSLARVHGMRKMILDMLDLTTIESGNKERNFTKVDLIALLNDSVETVTQEARQRNITIEISAPEELVLNADPTEIEIILNNLVTNSVKYNKDGGNVEIEVEHIDSKAVIKVADTGIGMSKEDQEKLFNDFVRIKNEKTRGIVGSGLGLSTLKKLVTLYNGEIDLQSEPDVGSTFTVQLESLPE